VRFDDVFPVVRATTNVMLGSACSVASVSGCPTHGLDQSTHVLFQVEAPFLGGQTSLPLGRRQSFGSTTAYGLHASSSARSRFDLGVQPDYGLVRVDVLFSADDPSASSVRSGAFPARARLQRAATVKAAGPGTAIGDPAQTARFVSSRQFAVCHGLDRLDRSVRFGA